MRLVHCKCVAEKNDNAIQMLFKGKPTTRLEQPMQMLSAIVIDSNVFFGGH